MTTDDQSRSPSEDLVRRARESIQEEPPVQPEPPLMGAGSDSPPVHQEPASRVHDEPPPAPPARFAADAISRPDAPIDYRRGLVFAIAAALAGTIVWALILAYAEIQAWVIGIGIGYLVGLAAIRGAGKMSNQLRVAAIVLTVAAVVAGELLGTALLFNKELGFFDMPFAVEVYFDNIGGDFAFALGAAAFGVWAALSATRN